jgi:hypothetical protein
VIIKDYTQVKWHLGLPLPGVRGTLGEQLLPLRMLLFFTISGDLRGRRRRSPLARSGQEQDRKILLSARPVASHSRPDSDVHARLSHRSRRAHSANLGQLTITPSNRWCLFAPAVYFAIAKVVRRLPISRERPRDI